MRARRIWINNQENIPLDLAVMGGATLVSFLKASENVNVMTILFYVYTALRYGWVVFYKLKINNPPVRSVCFVLSKVVMLVVLIMALAAAFDDN